MLHRVVAPAWRACAWVVVALAVAPAQAQTGEWIVDNADPGVAIEGAWAARSNWPGYWGSNFLHDRASSKDAGKSVRFAVNLPSAGRYELFMRWPAARTAAAAVPVDIVHAGGTSTQWVDQTTGSGTWVSLGLHELMPQGSAVVVRTAGTVGYVVADAVRVVGRGSSGGTDPYAGAPACPTHDDRSAHGLWDRSRGCHHDHTHNSDPDAPGATSIFGSAGAYLQGKTISYPWQTHGHDGTAENVAKHNGYKWFVDLDLPPIHLKLNWLGTPAPNAVKAIRTQYHFLSTNADARVRLHSFWAEMQVCPAGAMNDCGIVRGGGLWDTGILHVPYKQQWIPVPGQDPADLEGKIFRPGVDDPSLSWPTVDPYRGHSDTCQSLGVYSGSVVQTLDNSVLWTSAPGVFGYNHHMGIFMKVLDAAHCVEPGDISRDVAVCPDGRCRFNGSEHVPFTYWAWVDPALDGSALDLDGVKNGRVSFRGFTDEKGKIDSTCVAPGEHCVPYALESAPVGWAAWETPSNDGRWPERYKDFDVSPPGEWWITGPN